MSLRDESRGRLGTLRYNFSELRRLLGDLRAAEKNLRAEDLPIWVEVLSVLLALGLILRDGVHVYTALFVRDFLDEDIQWELAKNDVTLASPVLGLLGHRFDRVARFVTLAMGMGIWMLFNPFAGYRVWYADIYLAITIAVCVGDPLAFILDDLRARLAT